jgi:GxxExxY protein
MMRRESDSALNQLTQAVIGAAIEVHRELGPGFLKSVYEEALSQELTSRQIPYVRQAVINIHYKGSRVGEGKLDLLVDKRLIVELKSVEVLAAIHKAQVISYLKTTGLFLGLLINFNVPVLKDGVQRIVLS